MDGGRGLVVGAVLGVLLAAAGLWRSGESGGVPRGAIAVVDGREIPRAEYERRLAALAADRSAPLDAADRRRVRERLIEEELLLGRALALDLPRRDLRARKDLIAAVVEAVVATSSASEDEPSEAELRAFHADHRDFFAGTPRFVVDSLWFAAPTSASAGEALERARRAARALGAGEAIAEVRGDLADEEAAPLPRAPLPLADLVERLGPTAARAATEIAPGGVSEPVRVAGGYRILVLEERVPGAEKPFEEQAERVLFEWRRRRDERALERALSGLRARATVEIASDAE